MAYALTPKRFRYLVLLAASIAANFVYNHFLGVFILVTSVSVYLCGLGISALEKKYSPAIKSLPRQERKKPRKKLQRKKYLVLAAVLIVNLGILFTLKYLNFFAELGVKLIGLFGKELSAPSFSLVLPLGISYYTLQAIGYAIDVAGGKYEAERNPAKVALFVCFFPQLTEGPIGRYNEMHAELTEGAPLSSENVFRGFLRGFWGLFKILIVANRFGTIVGEVFGNYAAYGGMSVVLGALAFTVQLYAEFSGYIDVAAGVSEVFGIHLKKNFDKPFLSKDVGEFWRRWHISLGSWFRDYVFFPITASERALKLQAKDTRGAKTASVLLVGGGMFAVWFLTGLWHGASVKYIVYGLYYFLLMILHEALKPLFSRLYRALKIKEDGIVLSIFRVLKTFALVTVGMLLFRADNLFVFGKMFASVFSGGGALNLFAVIDVKDFVVALAGLAALIVSGILSSCRISLGDKFAKGSLFVRVGAVALVVFAVIVFGAYGPGYLPPDPIYGGF